LRNSRQEAAFGTVPLTKVTRHHVEGLVSGMAAKGLSGRTIGLTLMLTRAVFQDAVHDGILTRNPAARVEAPAHTAKARTSLTAGQVAKVAQVASADRLHAAWLLTLAGLRRSEVLGLTWHAVDLTAGTVSITQGRVLVGGSATQVGPTKTRKGERVLPLTEDMRDALRAYRRTQAAERLALGQDYADAAGLVFTDEVGVPLRPERYSDRWREVLVKAGAPALTLHEARHSSVTLMRERRVPDHVVAAWHGHDESVVRSNYTHALAEPLVAAAEVLAHLRANAL
jgi:integrase